MPTALIIGRFQPFHLGHLRLVREALKNEEKAIIGVGSSQYSGTPNNPFSAQERRAMITASVRGRRISIHDVPDIGDNARWVNHVEGIVPKFDVVYTNGELERRLFRDAGYRIHATGLYNRDKYSGVEVRRRIKAGEEWESLVPAGTRRVMADICGAESIRSSG